MQIWQLPIIGGAVPIVVHAVAAVFLAVVLVRRWDRRALLWAVIGAVAGAGLAVLAVHLVDRSQVFGADPLPAFVLQ